MRAGLIWRVIGRWETSGFTRDSRPNLPTGRSRGWKQAK